MDTTPQDVNPEVDSSTTSSAVEQSSTPAPAVEAKTTLADVIKSAYEKSAPPADAPEPQEPAPEPEAKAEPEPEPEPEADPKSQDKEAKGPIPYERFAEVNSKKVELEKQLEASKPLLEAHQSVIKFCQNEGISQEQFQSFIQLAALANNQPAEALKQLQSMVAKLESDVGEALSPDLQAAVDSGALTLDYAKRLSKAEKAKELEARRTQHQRQQHEQQLTQQAQVQLQTAFSTWLNNKQTLIPDFKPSGDGKPGIYELVMNDIMVKAPQSAIGADPQKLLALAEQSLASILPLFNRPGAPRQTRPPLRTSQTNTGQTESAPKTLKDVVFNVAKRNGIAVR